MKHSVYNSYYFKLTSVHALDCKYINYTYLHSLGHQLSCGFIFVNVFEETFLLNLTSGFITVRNDNLTANTNHKLHIVNFQAYNIMNYIHIIKIEQYYTNSDFTAKILGVNLMNQWVLLMTHVGCTGHNVIYISDCNFTGKLHNNIEDYY